MRRVAVSLEDIEFIAEADQQVLELRAAHVGDTPIGLV